MAITAPLASLIVQENAREPLGQRLLTLGRQDVCLAHADGRQWTDREFFARLGIERFDVLDISGYEGANIVQDLTAELSPALCGRYDFVLNGSCLDNCFDPAAALRNISRLLAANGRVMHMEHGSDLNGPWLMFSPGWLVDYYEANGFADVRAYAGLFRDQNELYNGPWRFLEFDGSRGGWAYPPPRRPGEHVMIVVTARKLATSRNDNKPIQWMYRPENVGREHPAVWIDRGLLTVNGIR